MKTPFVRTVVAAVGISVSLGAAIVGQADEPNHWNSFRKPSTDLAAIVDNAAPMMGGQIKQVVMQNAVENLPAPVGQPIPNQPYPQTVPPVVQNHQAPAVFPQQQVQYSAPVPTPQPVAQPAQMHAQPYTATGGAPCATGDCGNSYAQAPCGTPGYGAPACSTGSCQTMAPQAFSNVIGPISPYFGGLDILFWDIAESSSAVFATYDNGAVVGQYLDLDPDSSVGFNARMGRYLGCGAYGLEVGVMYWDPDPVCHEVRDVGAGLRFTHPALRTVSINRGGGPATVYDDYDTNATYMCVERDIRTKGIEVNLSHFGLLGARRLGSNNPPSLIAGRFGNCHGNCGGYCDGGCGGGYARANRLFGGAIGPLARACSGRVRIRSSHGFRWFQLEDEFMVAGDVDGMPGLGGSDLYYEIETENNLYGYQFGSQLSYCMGCRLMLNISGKIGVYGNDARFYHRISNDMVMAYTDSQGAGAGDLDIDQSDTSLAGLGELDFGIGYRISNRLTATGGYRILSACGVATSIGSMPNEYTSVQSAGRVRADDCFTMLGAYVGFNYNW